jgi:hypothetical protein
MGRKRRGIASHREGLINGDSTDGAPITVLIRMYILSYRQTSHYVSAVDTGYGLVYNINIQF